VLRSTTFQALSRLRYRSVDLFDNQLRWCPVCWEQDVDLYGTAYFRLFWAFREVDHCQIHNVQLESRCPHCDTRPMGAGLRPRIDSCPKCGESLTSHQSPMPVSNLFCPTACCPDLHDLLCAFSADPDLEFEPQAAQDVLKRIFDRIWELNDERAFWEIAPRLEMLAIVTSDEVVTVKTLRRAAYWLGVDFSGLLAGEIQCYTGQLDPKWLNKLPESMRPKKRRDLVDRKELLTNMSAVRASIDPENPPSLAQVAKLVGVSTGELEYIHPEICREIKAKYRSWQEMERVRKRSESMVEVWRYLDSDIPEKSRKHALKTIRMRTKLPKNVLREVIKAEFAKAKMGV